jgi:shikimate dehydrogenase
MKIYGIFGDPIEHSLSPQMHNAAFKAMGLDAHYDAFHVSRENLREALLGARAMGLCGLNLTIPLKELAMATVRPDDLAREIGAINTVSFCKEMHGYNTDGLGAKKALEDAGAKVEHRKIIILGAGGAARAIAYTLAKFGADVAIANRNRERAMELASRVGGRGYDLTEIEGMIPDADIVINATSIGMKDGDGRIIEGELLRPGQVVFDIVYNRETELLKDARVAGATSLDGVSMLVHQGKEAIKIWTGLQAPADVMEKAVRDTLAARRNHG